MEEEIYLGSSLEQPLPGSDLIHVLQGATVADVEAYNHGLGKSGEGFRFRCGTTSQPRLTVSKAVYLVHPFGRVGSDAHGESECYAKHCVT